jgi:acetylornithine aminotransferase
MKMTISSNAAGVSQWQQHLMNNYGTPQVTLTRGEGAYVWDADGNKYLDLLAGIAVNALGHQHPAIVEAVTKQINTLSHVSNFYATEPTLALADRLIELSGHDGRVLFCNSGAEANEAALKISRRTGKTKIISTHGGFHGRTFGALSVTGQPGKQTPFLPLVPGVEFVEFGNAQALRDAIDDQTAAVIVEPIQGEGGVIVPPADYLAQVRAITAAAGALFILDEVQTGVGRLGSWFAFQQAGVLPDVVTLAKGLGGGLPLGATIAFGAAGDLFEPGQHGTTFGGNPICTAAGLAVIDTIAKEGLLSHVSTVGKNLTTDLEAIDGVKGVRGEGLLLGVILDEPGAAAFAANAKSAGFLVNAVQPDVIRLAPPLILTQEQATDFVTAVPDLLEK